MPPSLKTTAPPGSWARIYPLDLLGSRAGDGGAALVRGWPEPAWPQSAPDSPECAHGIVPGILETRRDGERGQRWITGSSSNWRAYKQLSCAFFSPVLYVREARGWVKVKPIRNYLFLADSKRNWKKGNLPARKVIPSNAKPRGEGSGCWLTHRGRQQLRKTDSTDERGMALYRKTREEPFAR